MNVIDALLAAIQDGKMAYRRSWRDDPVLKGIGIVNHKQHGLVFWNKDAPVPDRYADDDPRIGVCVGTLTIDNIMADDWEIEEPWKVVRP